jgi:hypothetical protein
MASPSRRSGGRADTGGGLLMLGAMGRVGCGSRAGPGLSDTRRRAGASRVLTAPLPPGLPSGNRSPGDRLPTGIGDLHADYLKGPFPEVHGL